MSLLRDIWRLGSPGGPVPVLALAAAAMLATQLAREIHDVDIFWQLKLGELTLAHGLPRYEPFLAGKEREPLVAVAWLAQVVYATVRQLGGWPLLRLVDALVWFGGFAVVAWCVARRAANHWPAAAGLWVGWMAAVGFASVRPQSFAVLGFGLLVVLARSDLPPRRALLLGGPLLVLWQNLHPSVAVGVVYLGSAAAVETLLYLLGRRPGLPWRLIGLLTLAVAATVLTPAGVGVFRVAAYNAEISKRLGVSEWLPLDWFSLDQGWPAIVTTLLLALARGRRLRLADVFPVLALSVLTAMSLRFIVFWGVAAIPVWADGLMRRSDDVLTTPRPPFRRAVAVAAFAAAVAVPMLLWPTPFAAYYPFAGVERLKAAGVRGVIYSNFFYGGVLTDAGHPGWKVTHDGRYYLFTPAEWDDYFRAAAGAVPVAELERRYAPAAFFLRPDYDDGLITRLRTDPGWREMFADANSVVFVRR